MRTSLAALPSIDFNAALTVGLLTVLTIIFLLFGLIAFGFYARKSLSFRRGGLSFKPPRKPVSRVGVAMLAFPLLVLLIVGANISATRTPSSVTLISPTTISTSGSHSSTPTRSGTVTPPNDLVKHGVLTVGSDTTYPPQEYLDNNKPTGFDIALATAIANKMGLQVRIVPITFNNLLSNLNSKQLDVVISGVPIPSTNQTQAEFVPYLKSVESFMILKSNTSLANGTMTLADLCGKKVGVLGGSSAQNDLQVASTACKSGITINNNGQSNAANIVQLLQSGQIDVAYLDTPVANYYMSLPKYQDQFTLVGSFTETVQQGIEIRQNDSAMLNAVTQAFRALQKDGTYSKLLKLPNQWDFTSEDIGAS